MGKELNSRQWGDISPRIVNHMCSFCGQSQLSPEPRYTEVGNVDILAVSCPRCGHIELFDVTELTRIADKINEKYIREGSRKD